MFIRCIHCVVFTALCSFRCVHCVVLIALCSVRCVHCAVFTALYSLRCGHCVVFTALPCVALRCPAFTLRVPSSTFEGGVEGFTVAFLAGSLGKQAKHSVRERSDPVWADAEGAVLKVARGFQQARDQPLKTTSFQTFPCMWSKYFNLRSVLFGCPPAARHMRPTIWIRKCSLAWQNKQI